MAGLTIGSLTLDPVFDAETTAYTTTTTNATNKITATPADEDAAVTIKLNDTEVENGENLTWETGENTVAVTVTNGGRSTIYTVTVTKS